LLSPPDPCTSSPVDQLGPVRGKLHTYGNAATGFPAVQLRNVAVAANIHHVQQHKPALITIHAVIVYSLGNCIQTLPLQQNQHAHIELHVYSSMWSEAEALSEYGVVPE
jgi:hypothetical protein